MHKQEENNKEMEAIFKELLELYSKKNKDYGNSFDKSLDEDGLIVLKIRLGDKFNRFSSLIKNNYVYEVEEESLRDTLIDLANYAVMGIRWMDNNIKN